MKLAYLLPSLCRATTVALTVCLLGVPALARAVDATPDVGVRLLQAELLPAKVTLPRASCEQLVIAVSKTTLAHPHDALAILRAALTRGVRKLRDDELVTLPCTCARRIFLASLAAAPRRSSEFLDLAMELYPDCTPEFAEALRAFESQGLSGRNGGDSPAALGIMESGLGDSMVAPVNLGDDGGGFGVGFGPGFPGSPGFTGSGPSGGLALPPVAVTSVVNG